MTSLTHQDLPRDKPTKVGIDTFCKGTQGMILESGGYHHLSSKAGPSSHQLLNWAPHIQQLIVLHIVCRQYCDGIPLCLPTSAVQMLFGLGMETKASWLNGHFNAFKALKLKDWGWTKHRTYILSSEEVHTQNPPNKWPWTLHWNRGYVRSNKLHGYHPTIL